MEISDREFQVLVLITQELSTTEIAERLYLSAETIRSHRKNIIRKFQVKNTAGIVRRAFELGFLSISA